MLALSFKLSYGLALFMGKWRDLYETGFKCHTSDLGIVGSGQCEGVCDGKDRGVEVKRKCAETAKAVDDCIEVVRE